MNFFTRLKQKVETMATSPYAVHALFPLAFFEAIIFPIPPEVLLVAILSYKKNVSWIKLGALSTFGSLCGALVMYIIGYFFYDTIGQQLVTLWGIQEEVNKTQALFNAHAFLALSLAAFTLLPDRIFTLAAGIFSLSLPVFISAIFVGRGLRAWGIAYLTHRYGEAIRQRAFGRYEQVLMLIAMLILASAYFALK